MLIALSSFDVVDVLLNERDWTQTELADHLSALYRQVFVASPPRRKPALSQLRPSLNRS